MTTYPLPTDPVSALARANGTTKAHSNDHGRIIDMPENVKAHGATGDGVTDDTAAFQAAIDAGVNVFIPAGGNYLITNKLTVSNIYGLNLVGSMTPGTGPRLICNNFPADTDVFEFTGSAGFPACRFENLFVDSTAGTPPRDFYRHTLSEKAAPKWRNVWIQHMGGYAYNCPNPMQVVGAHFEECHFAQNDAGGTYIDNCTASRFAYCRWVGNAPDINGGADAEFRLVYGVTIDTPIFDGYWPEANDYDRLRFNGTSQGITIINPYVEWSSNAATGVTRNIVLTNCGEVILIGGHGNMAANTTDMLPVDINGGYHIMLLEPPLQTWRGNGTYGIRIQNTSGGVTVYAEDTTSAFSVDAASAPDTTIHSGGKLLRYGGGIGANVSGTTADLNGLTAIGLNNGAPTTMTNLTGGYGGHIVTIIGTNGNTTLAHQAGGAGQFYLKGGANYNLPANALLMFRYGTDSWHEIGRP